jgi:L-asparaginase / beta-aspartyl-peptidase
MNRSTGKMPGRVGDTPLVGCGGYCDDSIGACSATGHGETIARVCLCRHITGLMENGIGAREAAEKALNYMRDRTGGTGGVIVISNQADVGFHFTSKRMAWAYVKDDQLHYGINAGEDFVEPY